MYLLSSVSEGVVLINSSPQPHPLQPELSTAAPVRVGRVGHKVRPTRPGRQLFSVLKQMFEPESLPVCVVCAGR